MLSDWTTNIKNIWIKRQANAHKTIEMIKQWMNAWINVFEREMDMDDSCFQ